MKKRGIQCVTVCFLVFVAFSSYAGDFKNIVVFGDSLSDTGNIFAVSEGTIPPAPYYEGRFSNGPVCLEYIVESIRLPGVYMNYAHGGAQTGYTNTNGDFPGFLTQIEAYKQQLEIAKSYPCAFAMPGETLFVVQIGANDFWSVTDPASTIAQALENIQTGMTELMLAGATQFLVMNVPDLGITPRFNKSEVGAAQASQLIEGFNQALEQLTHIDHWSDVAHIDHWSDDMEPELEIILLDVFSFIRDVVSNSDALGFTNAVDAKLDKEQGTIGEGIYVFWDDVHPTSTTHKLTAKWALDQIDCPSCKSNPLPYFEEGLVIALPHVELEGNTYGFKLLPYLNPNMEGLFWKLDYSSLTVK